MGIILKILVLTTCMLNVKKIFHKQTIYFLTYNKVKMLKVVLFEISLDIRRYESNNQNVDVYY